MGLLRDIDDSWAKIVAELNFAIDQSQADEISPTVAKKVVHQPWVHD